jgi:hypothetical protein
MASQVRSSALLTLSKKGIITSRRSDITNPFCKTHTLAYLLLKMELMARISKAFPEKKAC